ncbi:MAG: nicotinate (nicotinamide) nucleotide adenylyltransferase [Acidobacteria bacterium]|nr:MAG: nicotinate (nicotinamide) nucleotide adenylyltransferase [Acidobacteriota bacterium]GIK77163.1 MAG: putative nicotinate-nucleotide adenylyltransferase [Actinomycetes bacterium]
MSRARGVLGGAFNPPHIGHLLLAQEAVAALGLEEVLLVPTGVAPHKRIDPEPGPAVRLELAEAAVDGAPRLAVSAIEVDRGGPSFAYRTLEMLADEDPGSELTFVMGADMAAGLEGWKRPERVVELARIAVAARPGFDPAAIDRVLDRLGSRAAAARIEMPPVGISSTLIRARIAAGLPIRWMVPAPVERMIAARGLYGAAG